MGGGASRRFRQAKTGKCEVPEVEPRWGRQQAGNVGATQPRLSREDRLQFRCDFLRERVRLHGRRGYASRVKIAPVTALNVAAILVYIVMWIGLGAFFWKVYTIVRERDATRDRRADDQDFELGL